MGKKSMRGTKRGTLGVGSWGIYKKIGGGVYIEEESPR